MQDPESRACRVACVASCEHGIGEAFRPLGHKGLGGNNALYEINEFYAIYEINEFNEFNALQSREIVVVMRLLVSGFEFWVSSRGLGRIVL